MASHREAIISHAERERERERERKKYTWKSLTTSVTEGEKKERERKKIEKGRRKKGWGKLKKIRDKMDMITLINNSPSQVCLSLPFRPIPITVSHRRWDRGIRGDLPGHHSYFPRPTWEGTAAKGNYVRRGSGSILICGVGERWSGGVQVCYAITMIIKTRLMAAEVMYAHTFPGRGMRREGCVWRGEGGGVRSVRVCKG